ncbi:MAG: chorismate synthase, partial [Duncaniella sp.]|nr:chorismate synthase [Duncaniella sp.]
DYTYTAKYGLRDHRGGGRSSARETATRVVAGAFARQALAHFGISVTAWTSQVGDIAVTADYHDLDLSLVDTNPVRCPDAVKAAEMERLILDVKADGDTIGGVVSCVVKGVPAGLGDPVFGRLSARLADAMMSINASKGFEYGMGFAGVAKRGSESLDLFATGESGEITTLSNHSGGIQGGISNGADITFRVAFKPVATLLREVPSVDSEGRQTVIKGRGRHDPCVVPRAVPVVEAMAAIVLLDALLLNRAARI